MTNLSLEWLQCNYRWKLKDAPENEVAKFLGLKVETLKKIDIEGMIDAKTVNIFNRFSDKERKDLLAMVSE